MNGTLGEYVMENVEEELLNSKFLFPVNGTDGANTSAIPEDNVACCIPGPERIIVPFVFSIIVLLGCLGNILVIVVILKNREHHKNTTNLFILNLNVADVLFLVFCVPFHAIIYTTHNWPFGKFMCKFVHLVQYTSMVASVFTLMAMAFDRYMAVSYPLSTKHLRTPMLAFLTSIVIWILSVGIAMPWPIFYTVLEYDQYGPDPIAVCADAWGHSRPHKPTYYLLLFLICYVLPLVTIFVLSVLMVRHLWSVGSDAHYREGSLLAKRKVTRLVIVVVIVFAICWLPSHVMWLWTSYSAHTWTMTYTLYYVKIFAHILSYANSCMNPVIYAFLSTQFRKGLNRALHVKYSENRSQRTQQFSLRYSSKSTRFSLTPSVMGQRPSFSVGVTTL